VPQVRFFDHGERLKTFCILDAPVTSRIIWVCRIGAKSMYDDSHRTGRSEWFLIPSGQQIQSDLVTISNLISAPTNSDAPVGR